MIPLEFAVAPPPGVLRSTVPWVLVILLLLAGIGLLARRRTGQLGRLRWLLPALGGFQLALFALLAAVNHRHAPIAYRLDDASLTVRSRSGVSVFRLADFRSVAPDSALRWHHAYAGRGVSCQTSGRKSLGPYGAYGVTKPPGLPWVNLQLTDRRRVVALEGRVNLLVSPLDTERFVREVRRRLPQP